MYGAGNEPTTVEQFRQDFPEEMYDYSPHCFVKSYKNTMICKTKNLFPTSTAVGTLSAWDQSTTRQFEEDKWYMGISGNNYYAPNNIIDYELTENYVYINGIGNGYGIGKAFKCEPNQTYTISCKWIKNTTYFEIATGFYNENGKFLNSISAGYLVERKTFTTPANCKWFTVCFTPVNKGSTYVYNIQLEKGSTATDFVLNGYIQSYKKSLVCKTKNLFNQVGVSLINNDGSAADVHLYSWEGSKLYIRSGGYSDGLYFPPITLTAGTYTISAIASMHDINGSGRHVSIGYRDSSGEWHSTHLSISIDNQKISYSFTLTEETVIRINLQGAGSSSNYDNLDTSFWDIQLELGDTATDYVPYGHL